MKKLIALVLAVLMTLSLAACTSAPAETTAPATTAPATQPSTPALESTVSFFSLTLGENYENIHSLTAFTNDDGTAYIEYVC